MKIIFVRHGESEANIHSIISNTGYIHGLTDKGKMQADSVALYLKDKYKNIAKIYSSPLKRAHETSDIIRKILKIEYVIDKRLIEFYAGELEGKSDEHSWREFFGIWDLWLSGKDYSVSIPGGETHHEIVERVDDFLKMITDKHSENDVIICVSHGGVIKTALPHVIRDVKAKELSSFDLKNTHIVELHYSRSEGLSCLMFGSPVKDNFLKLN